MSTLRSWRAPAWCLLAFLFLSVAGWAVDYNYSVPMESGADADIRLTVPGGKVFRSGFMPVRVRISNRSTAERKWRLVISSAGAIYGGTGLNNQSAFSFPVAGSATSEFVVWAPIATLNANRGGMMPFATFEGPDVNRSGFMISLNAGWGSASAPAALDPALEESLQKVLSVPAALGSPGPAAVSRRGRTYTPPPRTIGSMERISVIDPAAWPADWRMWSAFPLVILKHGTWMQLDESRRHALEDWVVMGGRLVLVQGEAKGGTERLGAGEIVTLTRALDPSSLSSVGFFDASLGNSAAKLALPHFWELPLKEWELKPKVRWLTGFILIFGLLVGPVNLFFFAPAGRRQRLFFTVPVISFAAALVLFTAISISDGFGGEGARRSLVVLLPERNQAVLQQHQVSRTGLLGNRKFVLPADALFEGSSDEPQVGREFWREGDKAYGDWFSSRSTQVHALRRLISTRERVEIVGTEGGAPIVQSTVSAVLRDFIYRDDSRVLWIATEVAPGTRVTLQQNPRAAFPGNMNQFAPANFPEGTFYAQTDRSDTGLMPTLETIKWRENVVLYTGKLKAVAASPSP